MTIKKISNGKQVYIVDKDVETYDGKTLLAGSPVVLKADRYRNFQLATSADGERWIIANDKLCGPVSGPPTERQIQRSTTRLYIHEHKVFKVLLWGLVSVLFLMILAYTIILALAMQSASAMWLIIAVGSSVCILGFAVVRILVTPEPLDYAFATEWGQEELRTCFSMVTQNM